MGQLICVDIKVNCALNPLRVEPEIIAAYAYQKTDGTKVYLPCNGCSDAQGGEVCEKCYEEINRVLFKNPDWNPRDVIYPDIHRDRESQ